MEAEKDKLDNIKEMGTVAVQEKGRNIHCLTVIGQIEGHMVLPPQNKTTKYEHVIPQLVAIEEDKNISGLLLVLNTVGGDVEAACDCRKIASMSKPNGFFRMAEGTALVYRWLFLRSLLSHFCDDDNSSAS